MRLLTTVLLSFCASLCYSQGGWLKSKGELYAQLTEQGFAATDYYNLNGVDLQTSQFNYLSTQLYAEYGLFKHLTTIISWPLVTRQQFETTEAVTGVGDLKIELKFPIYQKGLNIAFSVAPEIPIGNRNLFAQSKLLSFEQINLPSGDGEFNVWSTLAASSSIGSLPAYFTLHSSYNYRTHYLNTPFQDQWANGLKLGYNPFKALWIEAQLSTLSRVGEQKGATEFTRGNGTTYTSLILGVSYEIIRNCGLSLKYQRSNNLIVPQRNVYQANLFSLGIYYQRKPKEQPKN